MDFTVVYIFSWGQKDISFHVLGSFHLWEWLASNVQHLGDEKHISVCSRAVKLQTQSSAFGIIRLTGHSDHRGLGNLASHEF